MMLMVVATAAFSQNTITKIKSKALGDSISVQRGSLEITPIIVTANGDTARSMGWYTTSVARDTTIGFNAVITLYDKTAQPIAVVSQQVPGQVFTRWLLFLNKVDNYILNQRRRIIKQ